MTQPQRIDAPRALRRAVFALVFIAGLCSPLASEIIPDSASQPIHREMTRSASPARLRDAVLLETRSGIFTRRYSYEVYIVGHGMRTAGEKPVLSATSAENIAVRWRDVNFLEISYRKARIEQFTNYWPDPPDRNPRTVEIGLAPLSGGFSYLVPGPGHDARATLPAQ
jgi:hypothetical protein